MVFFIACPVGRINRNKRIPDVPGLDFSPMAATARCGIGRSWLMRCAWSRLRASWGSRDARGVLSEGRFSQCLRRFERFACRVSGAIFFITPFRSRFPLQSKTAALASSAI